jgi:hypothetical protein
MQNIRFMGGKESTAGVAVLVAEWLVNKAVQVTRVIDTSLQRIWKVRKGKRHRGRPKKTWMSTLT